MLLVFNGCTNKENSQDFSDIENVDQEQIEDIDEEINECVTYQEEKD